ncbi:NAD(P)/FAD-dependent oxidoreductase [Aeromonas veronii]|uniref:NAD(P)/FAD-dependent oxidoreductase n=1 Tax=Aeromonas veronii TaxID=654 RepID=UPI0015D08080|nr:FAD-dependent oxidoreductase [Aeromonas veronii]QLH67991.1 FAD-binding oxidoreductase [Aeromonas veronii]
MTSKIKNAVILGIALSSFMVTDLFAKEPELAKFYDENTSYWNQFLPKVNPSLTENIDVDVAVIGGGYTGLSAAYHIKKSNPDSTVVILEAKRVGNGASGRNGALVLAQTYSEGGFVMGDHKEHHKEIYDITVKSMHRIKALAESTGIDPGYILNGQCLGLFDSENIAYAKDYVAKANKMGLPVEYWDKEKAVSMLGSPGLVGAVYDPNGGTVNPAKLVASLKKLAEDSGVIIYENSPVLAYEEDGDTISLPVMVADKKYEVTAKSIVIAANAYAGATLGFKEDEIEPSHTQVAITEPLTDEQYKRIGWKNNISWYDDQYAGTDSDATYHMVMTSDHRIVIGGGSVEYNDGDGLLYPGNLKKIESQIANRLGELYPSIKGIKIESTWDGIIAETKSKNELIGVTGTKKNIYFALGYNGGQGVNVAFLFGELVSKLYNKESDKLLDIMLTE